MAVVVFQIIPGPGTVAILDATARNGVGVGMKAVFGTLTGDFIYMMIFSRDIFISVWTRIITGIPVILFPI
jgi:threonine/homoserine/homoserine lactone efflux protein